MATLKRIHKELKDISIKALPGISAGPVSETDMFVWKANIVGPDSTPYEGGIFEINVHLPKDYPFRRPNVWFATPVFHPNITKGGSLSLEILWSWSPAVTILKVLQSCRSLLADPNPDNPLIPDIAKLFKENRLKYDSTATEWTMKYAM